MKPNTTILLLTQMHKRPLVSELFCLSALRLIDTHRNNYTIHIHALVSDAESQAVCVKYNIPFTLTCASPLGRKMNTGIDNILSLYNFDYLLKIDDDDVVDSRLLNIYEPFINNRVPYFGIKKIYFMSPKIQSAVLYEYPFETDKLLGPGKMILRSALERTGWKQSIRMKKGMVFNATVLRETGTYTLPAYQCKYMEAMRYGEIVCPKKFLLYDDDQMRSLDYISEMNFLFNGYHPFAVNTDKPVFTDVKTDTNIWKFESYSGSGKAVQVAEATAFWSDEERAHLKKLL